MTVTTVLRLTLLFIRVVNQRKFPQTDQLKVLRGEDCWNVALEADLAEVITIIILQSYRNISALC